MLRILPRGVRAPCLPLLLAVIASGCQVAPKQAAAPTIPQATATHEFAVHENSDVVGRLQLTHAHAEDTLSDIARRFNLGYEEIVRANPGVDPWLPKEGTPIVLPTQFVLPEAPRSGIVINLAALRLYYYPPVKKGEPQTVITHPIGIGLIGWRTPTGTTRVVSKRRNPWWYPTASVRREHREDGDILPARVAPGPDNPLGRYAMNLAWPSYLIHGTNQPYGIGIRASHGCIRLYPEDIALLFDQIPVGTRVTVVNQPQVYGRLGNTIYLQSYPVLEDYPAAKQRRRVAPGVTAHAELARDASVNQTLAAALVAAPKGIAIPVSLPDVDADQFIAHAREVENRLPQQATWDGVE